MLENRNIYVNIIPYSIIFIFKFKITIHSGDNWVNNIIVYKLIINLQNIQTFYNICYTPYYLDKHISLKYNCGTQYNLNTITWKLNKKYNSMI